MHKLVPDDMGKLLHRTLEGNDHASLEELKKTTDPFRDEPGRDVRLLEMEMRAVENKRDAVGDIMVELLLEMFVTLLREERPALREFLHLGVIINVEVLGAENLPFKFRVLDLVATEVIKLSGRKLRQEQERENMA